MVDRTDPFHLIQQLLDLTKEGSLVFLPIFKTTAIIESPALLSSNLLFGLYILLFILLLVSFLLLGFIVWNYSVNKAVQKRLMAFRDDVLDLSFDELIDGEEDPWSKDVFFLPTLINFFKKRSEIYTATGKRGESTVDLSVSDTLKPKADSYNQFLQKLPDLAFECNLDGTIQFLNHAATDILGVNPDQMHVKPLSIFEFIHHGDSDRVKKELQALPDNQEVKEIECRVRIRDNSFLNVLCYVLPVMSSGKTTGIRGMLIDISKRKKYEHEINTLKDIVSNIELGVNVYKLEDNRDKLSFLLEMVNDYSGQLMKFSNESNIGKKLDDIFPLFRHRRLHEKLYHVVQSGEPDEIDEFGYQPDPLFPEKILSMKMFPLPQQRVVMLIEDVTLRKKAEQSLKMTSFGIENAGDMIFWVDENARFLFANNTACEKYGYTKQELMGMSLTDVDSRISMMQWFEIMQILQNKASLNMESINVNRQGESFPVEVSISRFSFSGKNYYFSFVRDISDRKRNDELEQKIQVARKSAALKQQFLANMSHEIRTPMTGIMGMTSLLMRSNLSPAQVEYVRNIKISSENLLNIINDVLDLSKIEAGKMELKPVKIHLREFVNEIREMFHHQSQSQGIRFTTSIEPLIPTTIIADEQRLKQIINNLLSNAFKFTDEGEISLRFGVEQKKDKEIMLNCRVKDTGMGISPENQKQIFEKFTQIDSSLIRPFEGTGLGLAICRELTQLMGGEINVESEPGEGSTFTFTFVADYDKDEKQEDIQKIPKDFSVLKLNVLHVEDKLLNQKVVGFLLLNAGCNVDFVKNGQEAIDAYKPGKYDVILMDLQMPVMDGITAYKELRRLHGEKLCAVIGLSANAMEGDAQKYMGEGLNDYIVKPFEPAELYEKLTKWGSKKNAV